MIDESQLGQRIKALRKKKEYTLEDLSKIAGLTKGYLSKVENSKKSPPVSTLIKLGQALGVSISEIFGENKKSAQRSITKKDERPIVSRSASSYGYSYESLASGFYYRNFLKEYGN